ncbi:hypothetical protein NP234_23790 [Salmonella enterica]|nr:hypothetical protein [Salmonella enterica]
MKKAPRGCPDGRPASHYLLKEVHLPKDSTLAIDRGYLDVAQFQRLPEEGVCYATKMKKNLKYEALQETVHVGADGRVASMTSECASRGATSRTRPAGWRFSRTAASPWPSLPTISTSLRRTWPKSTASGGHRVALQAAQAELPAVLHFFYGESVNAIHVQTWVVLIANLLPAVLPRRISRPCAFSQIVAMARLTLMYYLDFTAFMENPDRGWDEIQSRNRPKGPPEPDLFSMAGLGI